MSESVAPCVQDRPERPVEGELALDLIELLFFAYRDFVAEADAILDDFGLGRAHHRVLHFVMRQPGLPIADLLATLRITKQSLNRVLKDLVERDFIEQRTGTTDRRQRLLVPTRRGRDLALRLASVQTRRLLAALPPENEEARRVVTDFLIAMADRDGVRPRP